MGHCAKLIAGNVAAFTALASVSALAQDEVADPPDPWIHAPTGTAFPADMGEFRRVRVVEYTSDGRDASAGYNLARGDRRLIVTIYVYPSIPQFDCQATYEDAKRSVGVYEGSELVFDGFAPPPSGGAGVAWQTRYLIPAGGLSERAPEVLSDLYLYCPEGGEWLVKVRASWNSDVDLSDDLKALVRAIEWPARLGG